MSLGYRRALYLLPFDHRQHLHAGRHLEHRLVRSVGGVELGKALAQRIGAESKGDNPPADGHDSSTTALMRRGTGA